MIRTQVYIEEQTHKDLVRLADQEKKSMAEVTRDILKEGIKKRKTVDMSGVNTLLALANIGGKSDDPYLSENIDHYLSLQRHLIEMRAKTLPLGLFLLMMIAQISGIKWPHAT